ncbi:MAG: hypothetical protein AAFY48_22000 [Bacteroidota bacterium]
MANSVSEFEQLILDELELIQDAGTIRTIQDLIEHAAKEEKKANPPEMRMRPDEEAEVNAAYFRNALNFDLIPSESLQQNINNLLDYLAVLENSMQNAE